MNWTVKDAEGYGAIIGIDWETAEFSPEDLLKGMLVELEHKGTTGGDPLKSAQIALDHLTESSRYYEFLEEVEEKFKKKARSMRRRKRTARRSRVAATEEELLRESKILAERVLKPLGNLADYASYLKQGTSGIVDQDEGFLFLVGETSFDMEELKNMVHEINREFREIQIYKGQHDDVTNKFQELSEEYMGPAPRR